MRWWPRRRYLPSTPGVTHARAITVTREQLDQLERPAPAGRPAASQPEFIIKVRSDEDAARLDDFSDRLDRAIEAHFDAKHTTLWSKAHDIHDRKSRAEAHRWLRETFLDVCQRAG